MMIERKTLLLLAGINFPIALFWSHIQLLSDSHSHYAHTYSLALCTTTHLALTVLLVSNTHCNTLLCVLGSELVS